MIDWNLIIVLGGGLLLLCIGYWLGRNSKRDYIDAKQELNEGKKT